MRAILNPGDEVIVPSRVMFPTSRAWLLRGGRRWWCRRRPQTGFRVSPEQIRAAITPKTKAILVSYPSNPTGATADRKRWRQIVELACEFDLYIVSDEIYDRLTYDGKHTCLPTLPGRLRAHDTA